MGRRILTFLIAFTLALSAYNFLPFQAIRHDRIAHGEWIWVALVVLIAMRIWLSRKDIHLAALTPMDKIGGNIPDTAHANEDIAKDSVRAFTSIVTPDQIDQLIETSMEPGSAVVRISETAELGAHDYGTQVERVVIRPPGYEENQMFVPVLSPTKGVLIDNFRLMVDEKPARTLSRRESTGASLAIMTEAFTAAFESRVDLPSELWRSLRDQIINPKADPDGRHTLVEQLENEYSEDADQVSKSETIARAGLWRVVLDICDTYTIIAVVPITGTSVKVKISYTRRREALEIPRDSKGEKLPGLIRAWLWIDIQLQILFGLIRRSDRYELPLSKEAQSYHFRATVPEGLYVYDLVGTWIDDARGVIPGNQFSGLPLRPIRPSWEISDTRGLEHVHAYGRDLDVWCKAADNQGAPGLQTSERTAAIRFELREKPPGLLFVVFLINTFLALLIVAAAKWHDLIFITMTNSKPGSPWPVVIFGVPAIISGWMVSRFTPESVKLLSVSTIGITGWSVINAAAAVAISAFSMSVPAHIWRWPILGYFEPAWSLLVVSCLACFAMSLLLLVFRVRRYGRRVRGKASSLVKK